MNCPNCNSQKVVKFGYVTTSRKGKQQRLKCQDCGKTFYKGKVK